MVSAVWGKPGQTYGPAFANSFNFYIKDVLNCMSGVGVVYPVHFDGVRIVIDCDIDATIESVFDAQTDAAAAGEVVDNERLIELGESCGFAIKREHRKLRWIYNRLY